MKHILPTSETPPSPGTVTTMADVKTWILSHADPATGKNPMGYLTQYITTLQSHCGRAPLETLPAKVDWIDEHFPKVKKGKHPRPDLGQNLDAYKKWRRYILLAIQKATGAETAKKTLRARQDGWSDLLAAAKLHTVGAGLVHSAKLSSLTGLSDVARRAGLEPWHLSEDDVLERLEVAFETPRDRDHVRRGLTFLNSYRFIPEIAELIPTDQLPVPSRLRDKIEIPSHIDDVLIAWSDKAAALGKAGVSKDLITGEDRRQNAQSTRNGYLAALRHHVRMLPSCPDNPDMNYLMPIRDLNAVNDVHNLFTLDHLAATLRLTEAVEHLRDTITTRTAYSYYSSILTVLGRNNFDTEPMVVAFKSSVFLEEGKELSIGMTQSTEDWCRALLNTPDRTRRFRNLHRILQARAQKILDTANAEGRTLTKSELVRVRQIGTAAAASAIEIAGRPIRLANAMGLRLRGASQNFFEPNPKRGRTDYSFHLEAHETKARKKAPPTKLRKELYGPQVLNWYLQTIRPLFPHAEKSIYLFPSVERAGPPLHTRTFDTWFQAASAKAELPMSFHRWRHGYATLLIAQGWDNLIFAAKMLGNTPEVCRRNYAWLEEEDFFEKGQEIFIDGSKDL